MIPKECKRLAEVDFPTAEVSRHAAREKSITEGGPWGQPLKQPESASSESGIMVFETENQPETRSTQ